MFLRLIHACYYGLALGINTINNCSHELVDNNYQLFDVMYSVYIVGGLARQQFRQKGEPSEFRQIVQLKFEKSDFYPKMTALVKL